MELHYTCEGFCFYNKKVLLVHHKSLNLWLAVGGHIDPNETPDETIKREFKEEVGFEIEILSDDIEIPIGGETERNVPIPFYIGVHNVQKHYHMGIKYICIPKDKHPPQLKVARDELLDAKWVSLQDLDTMELDPNVRDQAKKAFELYAKLSQ